MTRSTVRGQFLILNISLVTGQFTFCVESAEDGITYEHMQTIIESVLIESGYYELSVDSKTRTSPNGDAFGINQALKSA